MMLQHSGIIRKVFPVLTLTIFFSNLANGILIPILSLYAEQLGASGIWLGIIFAGVSITSAVLMPFAGRFSDRHGRKWVLAVGLLGLSLTSFAYLWAGGVVSLTLVRVIQGIATAMVMPIAQAYIGDIAPRGEEGKWMGLFNATFVIGMGLGPILGGVISDRLGIDAVFYFIGALNLVSALGVMVILPEVIERKKAAQLSFKVITDSKVVRGVFGFQFGLSATRGIMNTFLTVFATAFLGLSKSLIGVALTISLITNSILSIPFGALADKLNRRNMAVFGCIGVGIFMALVPVSNGFFLLLVMLLLSCVSDAFATSPALAIVVDEGRKYGMGATTSVCNMGANLGMGFAPIIAGLFVDLSDVKTAFFVSGAFAVFAVVVFRLFTREALIKKGGLSS